MSDRIMPAMIAAYAGVLLVLLLLVPYVTVQYRRRGALGPGRVVLAVSTLVYAVALLAYVLLPLPPVGPDFCQVHGVDPQLRPFQFVADIVHEGASSPTALIRNPAVLGVAFNIMLFVPFGALFRHLTGQSIATTAVAGAAVSMLVELTQVTGVWSLFPCAYRLFDVDDLITNTTGAFIGAMVVAPVLRGLPGQKIQGPPEAPRPLTTGRRLLGMLCDFLAVMLTGGAAHALAQFIDIGGGVMQVADAVAWLLPALGQLALIWWTGATLGEHSIRVRPTDSTTDLKPRAKLTRWGAGIGGYNLLIIPEVGITSVLASALAVANVAAAAFTRRHRGLAYAAAGLDLTDAREMQPAEGIPKERT